MRVVQLKDEEEITCGTCHALLAYEPTEVREALGYGQVSRMQYVICINCRSDVFLHDY